MALLKQIKFGAVSTPIAKTVVSVASTDTNVLSSTYNTSKGLNVDEDYEYTIGIAVDGKTITKTGNDGLATALKLSYHAAVTTGTPKAAYIALEDNTGTSIANSEINVSDIIGNGLLESADYDPTTGILTLTFANASGSTTDVEIDLHELFDIDDIVIKNDSQDFLSFTTSVMYVINTGETGESPITAAQYAELSAAEKAKYHLDDSGQGQLGVKLADVTYTATSGSTAATLTVNSTNGKMLDATDAVPAIKSYVDDVVSHASGDLAVTAEGDDYVGASVDATTDNKHVIVETNVQSMTASAGTRGTWTVTDPGDGTAATKALANETLPTWTGVADSLADSADIATSAKTYIDAKVAEEEARANAEVERAVKSLDVADSAVTGKVVTAVSEADGKISVTRDFLGVTQLGSFTADPTATGAIASTDTVPAALNKLQNKVDAVQYSVSGTTLEFFGMTQHA